MVLLYHSFRARTRIIYSTATDETSVSSQPLTHRNFTKGYVSDTRATYIIHRLCDT